MAASLLRRDKKSTAAHLKADLKRTDNSSGLRQLQELLDSVLNPERGSDPEALEWCKWLLAGGDGFDEFCRTVRSYDNATLCGLVWTANFVAYRCRTCGISPCMSLCAECFNNGDHTGHDFNMFRSQAGGACDCGDGNVMRESGFCSRHRLKTGENVPSVPRDLLLMSEMVLPRFIITIIQYLRDGYTEPESAADRDLQKVLQQLEAHISFLEELTKMGGAMRTVLTKILTNQQTFKELSMGQEENVYAKRNYEKYLSALKSSGLVSVEEKGAGGAGAADTPAGAGALSLLGATAAASLEDSSKEEDQDGLQGVGQRKRVKLSSSTKDPSIMDTLKHKCFLEELLFWTIKYEFPQKMVTFLLNMLPDQDYKITFTKTFVQHYAFIMKTLMKSHESDTMSNRIVHISVQLFSNEELARHVTEECQLLDIMVTVLLYMMESCLIKSELQDEENNRHVVVNCGEALLKNNTYWPLVSDFINILSHQSVAKRFLEDHSLLLLWMSFVSFFQGMNLNKRELNEHVEFESQTYYAAFAAELEACAQPMWGLLTHCKVKETQEYTKTVVRYCLETLQMWFDAIGFVDEPSLNQLTFHLPLHRYYAMFLSKGVKCQGLDLDSLLPDQEMLMKIMVHPLQIQASLSEIHSNMWVRNGLQIKGQAMTYVQSHFCNSMIDPDIYLLQVCASRLDPDYFISSVFERFKVVDLLTMASQHQNAVLDSEQERPMLEGALTFLVILCSLRIHLGMSDDEILRAEMVSQLCMNDRTHSSLLDLIPENPNPKSGVVPGSCSFEEMLSAVADFKAPVFEPGGSMQQGMYTPKADVWEKEFDPIMVILRTVYRRDVQSAMDRYAAFLKQSGIHTGNPWPPYKERTPLHPCYKGLVRLLHCKTLHIVIFTLLYKIWMDHQNMSEHVLCMVLYLIELGLDNQVHDDKVEEEPCIEEHCHDSWFPGTSLLSNLHHVINFVRVRVPETAPEVERKRERERERETPPSTSSESTTFGQSSRRLTGNWRENLREAQVFSLVAERRRKFQEIINRSNHEASQAVRPKSSSSRWLPPGSPPQLVTEILEIRESMLSLLVKLHQKLSAKQNSLSLSWLAEVDPAHHAHGDGLTAIERILAKAAARSRHSKRCLQEICGKVCPPIPPKKNSPGDKKSMDKEERRQRARERQQKLLAEFASRQKSFMETAMDVESPETDAVMDMGSAEPLDSEVLYDCVICGQSGPSTEDRPTGLVVLLQASSEHFTCVVKVLYSLQYTQALAALSIRFSREERLAWSNTGAAKKNMPNSDKSWESLLGQVISELTKAKDVFDTNSEETFVLSSSVWSPQSIEFSLQQFCLPFLRLSCLLQHHLYGDSLPGCLVEEEFSLLTGCLGLTGSVQSSGAMSSAACLEWNISAFDLISQWCSEVFGLSDTPAQQSVSLLVQNPQWAAPRLLHLPDNYNTIFQYYHRKSCTSCSKTPKDPALCLVCGAFVCLKGHCCKQQGVCECVLHSQHCGAATGIFLLINASVIIIIRGHRFCLWGSVYLDAHGEEDRDLRRGKPLYLCEERYRVLEQQWVSHTFDHINKRWGPHYNGL
ncbi:E3 ubiquitin-protein ligase ubr3 [Garra rufa]|uniref:E3 ubiquitin-protein ligase ubr3 n=1 Tax=Garra rufa TaxID=137080 RepID=UPI003CCE67EF